MYDHAEPPSEWNATPPKSAARDLAQVAIYRDHRVIGTAIFASDFDAEAFHAFVNGDGR